MNRIRFFMYGLVAHVDKAEEGRADLAVLDDTAPKTKNPHFPILIIRSANQIFVPTDVDLIAKLGVSSTAAQALLTANGYDSWRFLTKGEKYDFDFERPDTVSARVAQRLRDVNWRGRPRRMPRSRGQCEDPSWLLTPDMIGPDCRYKDDCGLLDHAALLQLPTSERVTASLASTENLSGGSDHQPPVLRMEGAGKKHHVQQCLADMTLAEVTYEGSLELNESTNGCNWTLRPDGGVIEVFAFSESFLGEDENKLRTRAAPNFPRLQCLLDGTPVTPSPRAWRHWTGLFSHAAEWRHIRPVDSTPILGDRLLPFTEFLREQVRRGVPASEIIGFRTPISSLWVPGLDFPIDLLSQLHPTLCPSMGS